MIDQTIEKALGNYDEDRLIRSSWEDPADLMPHEFNPKIHPVEQTNAVGELIEKLGWMARVKVNLRTSELWEKDQGDQRVIDGHDRIKTAMRRGKPVPVDYYDLTPEEERIFLTLYDTVGTMYVDDPKMIAQLLGQIENTGSEIDKILSSHAVKTGADKIDLKDPDDTLFGQAGLRQPRMITCPHCNKEFEK